MHQEPSAHDTEGERGLPSNTVYSGGMMPSLRILHSRIPYDNRAIYFNCGERNPGRIHVPHVTCKCLFHLFAVDTILLVAPSNHRAPAKKAERARFRIPASTQETLVSSPSSMQVLATILTKKSIFNTPENNKYVPLELIRCTPE